MDQSIRMLEPYDTCRDCGERLEGDGYTKVRHCPNIEDIDMIEPDASTQYCGWKDPEEEKEPEPELPKKQGKPAQEMKWPDEAPRSWSMYGLSR
jgi:hypothetical protein